MRKSKKEAARTRIRIVESARAELCRNGINATGLSQLMAAAGLTHGGFYRHFQSKDQLVAEACASKFDSAAEWVAGALSHQDKRNALGALAASYLSEYQRENQSRGCPFVALGSELVRSDDKTRAAATEAVMKIVDLIAREFRGMRSDVARRRALVAFSTMVGAMTLARIMTDTKLSTLLLREAAKHVGAARSRPSSPRSRPSRLRAD